MAFHQHGCGPQGLSTELPQSTASGYAERITAVLRISTLVLAMCMCTRAQNTLGSLTQGEPVVANTTGTTGATASSSQLYLDATQFAGADMCAQINTAYSAAAFNAVIDARGFTGFQACNSNPFHGKNMSVQLLLGNTQIVTSVPWWPPQNAHSIEGSAAGNSANNQGTILIACGPGAPTSANWNGTNSTCTVNSISIPQFPNATTTLTFNVPHGPFPTGTYACMICDGGQGTSEGSGWNSNAFAGVLKNVKLHFGGNNNVFGYYTENEQERSAFEESFCGFYGSTNDACTFHDRTEAPTGQAGPTHFAIHDSNLNPNLSADSSSDYGVVVEGSDITIAFTQGTCASLPTAWVTSVSGAGAVTATLIGNNGGSGCGTTHPTCTITGAPPTYQGTLVTNATCTPVISSGVVTSLTIGGTNSGYPQGFIGGGPDEINNFTAAGSANPGRMQEGI